MMTIAKQTLDAASERRLWRITDDAAALITSAARLNLPDSREQQLTELYMQALIALRDFNIGGYLD